MWYVRPAKPQISLRIRAVCCRLNILTEHHLEFLTLKEGCTGSPESTLVKMPHCCWKSHVAAQMVDVNSALKPAPPISDYNDGDIEPSPESPLSTGFGCKFGEPNRELSLPI